MLIEWRFREIIPSFHGLITWFPYCIWLEEGSTVERWRPSDKIEQPKKLDGHHHFNSSAVLVWVVIFGLIVHVYFTYGGSHHDRSILNYSEIIRSTSTFFKRPGEHVIGDTVFQGRGTVFCACKSNQNNVYKYKAIFKKNICAKWIISEWGIGAAQNRFRLLLGHLPLHECLWQMISTRVACCARNGGDDEKMYSSLSNDVCSKPLMNITWSSFFQKLSYISIDISNLNR